MSFLEINRKIKEGDLVLAWMTRASVKPIFVEKDAVLNTRYGAFKHNLMIGKQFGFQMASSSAQGFIHLLAPSPELWTLSLPHRTQIVYTPDASYIVQRLRIRPKSVVIEAGTGSGSFTHALGRTVGRNGKVFSFEFHEPRFIEASKEIQEHGLAEVVKVTHRDVCKDGFSIQEDALGAHAIFLDLPSPWSAIPHLKTVVSRDRAVHICCFSPCMEQVIKTVEVLKKEGYQRIEMVEVSAKKWEGHKDMVRDVDDAVERLRDVRRRRAEGLQRRNRRIDNERISVETAEGTGVSSNDNVDGGAEAPLNSKKRSRETGIDSEAHDSETPNPPGFKGFNPWGKGTRFREGDPQYEWRDVSRVESEIKGHTSYLTFALLPPQFSL